MTSEEKYELAPQPPNSCGLIDEAISHVSKALKQINNYHTVEDVEKLHNILWEVEYELDYLVKNKKEGLLEDIRKFNTDLRTWGQQWKDFCKNEIKLNEEVLAENLELKKSKRFDMRDAFFGKII